MVIPIYTPELAARYRRAMLQVLAIEPFTMPEQELQAAAYQVLANIQSGHTSDRSRDEARHMFTLATGVLREAC